MINIKRVKRDYIIFNQQKVDKYGWAGDNINKTHSHICGVFNNPRKVALRIRYNVLNNRVPTYSKFIYEHVGKRNYIRYLESHLRVTDDKEYSEKLNNLINIKKYKQEYHNVNNKRIR